TVGATGTAADNAGMRNVIGGSTKNDAMKIQNGAHNNTIAGNYFGINATGTGSLGSAGYGVEINAGAFANIFGTNGDGQGDAGEGNVVSGNAKGGVYLHDAGTVSNVVAG